MDAYREHLIGEGLSERTITIYVRLIDEAKRHLSLGTVKAGELADYAARLPFSHSYRGQFAAALNHYWRMIGRWDGPLRAIRVPPQPEMVCQAVDDDQARDIIKDLTWLATSRAQCPLRNVFGSPSSGDRRG